MNTTHSVSWWPSTSLCPHPLFSVTCNNGMTNERWPEMQWIHWRQAQWQRVIFTDESWFRLICADGRINDQRSKNSWFLSMNRVYIRPTKVNGLLTVVISRSISLRYLASSVSFKTRKTSWSTLSVHVKLTGQCSFFTCSLTQRSKMFKSGEWGDCRTSWTFRRKKTSCTTCLTCGEALSCCQWITLKMRKL